MHCKPPHGHAHGYPMAPTATGYLCCCLSRGSFDRRLRNILRLRNTLAQQSRKRHKSMQNKARESAKQKRRLASDEDATWPCRVCRRNVSRSRPATVQMDSVAGRTVCVRGGGGTPEGLGTRAAAALPFETAAPPALPFPCGGIAMRDRTPRNRRRVSRSDPHLLRFAAWGDLSRSRGPTPHGSRRKGTQYKCVALHDEPFSAIHSHE